MPELPEVETIKNILEPSVLKQTIRQVDISLKRMLEGCNPSKLNTLLKGQVIKNIIRRGKYIVFIMEKDTLVIHLGMTGQLTTSHTSSITSNAKKTSPENIQPQKAKRSIAGYEFPLLRPIEDRHTHLKITFENNSRLLFRDVRTFGKIIFHNGHNLEKIPRLSKLGVEPLEMTPKEFLQKHWPIQNNRNIKAFLLEQSFICGLGNIYVDESLYFSSIHPLTPVHKISRDKWMSLLSNIKKVLQKAILNSGTTFSDYRKPDGEKGSNQEKLKVYGRGGQPCYRCKTTLVKTVIAQRGTVYCPHCQIF